MARGTRLVRRSFFVSTPMLRRARRALGAASDGEAVRLSVERIAEMDAFWRFMSKSGKRLRAGSFLAEAVRARLHPDRQALEAGYKAAARERLRKQLSRDWKTTDGEGWPD